MWEDTLTASPRSLDVVIAEARADVRRKSMLANNPRVLARIEEVVDLMDGAYKGTIPFYRLEEVMSTSDFPIIYGQILDRQIMNNYAETPVTWSAYARRGTVRDFRQAQRIALDGMEQPFYPSWKKPELQNVLYDNELSETPYTTQVEVYEKGYALNWRMMVNEDLDVFRTLPQKLARGARRTEARFAAGLYMSSTGPNSTFFSNANANLVNTTNGALSNNPPLSVQGLRDAFNVLARMVDAGGDPIYVDGAVLVVPPALEITAREILRAVNINVNPGVEAGSAFTTGNWIGDKLTLAVEPYAPILNTTSGHTAWYLFARPNENRPALEVTFLRGYETPMMLEKAPNTQRVGGGLEPMLGDFEDMSRHYKGVHIIGGTLFDPKAAVASTGTGS